MAAINWEAIEELLRSSHSSHPLSDWSVAQRVMRHATELADDVPEVDLDRLHLLCWFCFLRERAADPAQRTQWMRPLRDAGISLETQMWLWLALQRFRTAPEKPEECLVHDAWNLEFVGALGLARMLRQGGEDGKQIEDIIDDAKRAVSDAKFLTPGGRRIGIRRTVTARRFLKELEEE